MTDAQLLTSLEQHGLSPSSIDYDLDHRMLRVSLHGVDGLWLESGTCGWRAVLAGATAGPTTIWDRAQAMRAEARQLDRLLGVLEDLGQRHPGDTEAA